MSRENNEQRVGVATYALTIGVMLIVAIVSLNYIGHSELEPLGALLGVLYLAISVKLYEIVAGYLIGIHRSFPYFILGFSAKLGLVGVLVVGLSQSSLAQAISFLFGVLVLIPASILLAFRR